MTCTGGRDGSTELAGESEREMLSPEDAFRVLGDETRMAILHTLGDAGEPLSFSELRERVGLPQGSQFNYHLDKLVGHFVRKTADGYTLYHTGRWVIEAILAGAVTDAPVIEPADVDAACGLCGAPIKVGFREESVRLYCTECAGQYGDSILEEDPNRTDDVTVPDGHGFIGELLLPPAGVRGRTPMEVLETAYTWGYAQLLVVSHGVCPRCSARFAESVSVCETHDATDGICDRCDFRWAAILHQNCPNCLHEHHGPVWVKCLTDAEVLAFLTSHDISLLGEYWTNLEGSTEEVRRTDPLEVRYTITCDDDTLTVTIDDDLSVVDSTDGTTSVTG